MKTETIETHTSEYSVKDCCIAIELTTGGFIFADECRFDGPDCVYVPRCYKERVIDWITDNTPINRIARAAIACISVGIYPRE